MQFTKQEADIILASAEKLNRFVQDRTIQYLASQGKTCRWYDESFVSVIDIGETETIIEIKEHTGHYAETKVVEIPTEYLFLEPKNWLEYLRTVKALYDAEKAFSVVRGLKDKKRRLEYELSNTELQLNKFENEAN
jgi:hypothetical protein